MNDKAKQKLIFNLDLYRHCKVTYEGNKIHCEFDSSFLPVVEFELSWETHYSRCQMDVLVRFSFNGSPFVFFFSHRIDEATESWLETLKQMAYKQKEEREQKVIENMLDFLGSINPS